MSMFRPATREKLRLRLGLSGPSGSGKTYTALRIAMAMGEKVAVIDTERRSASKYVGMSAADGTVFAFDVCDLTKHSPDDYTRAIETAARDYDVLIIDSLTHAWSGRNGALEQVDNAAKRNRGNSYVAWRDVTPKHNRMVDAILAADCHVIACLRSKTEYILELNDKGKMAPRKVGTKPIQRDGMEYEFDVFADMDLDHNLLVSKTRCSKLDGAVIHLPGAGVADTLMQWLNDGAEPAVTDDTKRKQPETKPTPKHDPSWPKVARRWCADLRKSFDLGYDELAAYLESGGELRPSMMTDDQRYGLWDELEAGRSVEVGEWLARREEGQRG